MLLAAVSAAARCPAGFRYPLIVALAVAMGIQNATARKLAVPDLTTTNVLTMTITGIAADSVIAGGQGIGDAGRRFISVVAMFLGRAHRGRVRAPRGHASCPWSSALVVLVVVAVDRPRAGRAGRSLGAPVTTFITRYDTAGSGIRLAVKDLIDMEGEPTTAGCRAVAERAVPAPRDAACMAGARAAGARIVGRTNLHELALGVTGINPWYGTPVNPLDPAGSPAAHRADRRWRWPPGKPTSPTAATPGARCGSPPACCGTAGLKTTWGRIPLDGVWPLSPSFDTVGPMARDVAGLVRGMELLEPGFAVAETTGVAIGRLRPPADPLIDAAVDRALHDAEWPVLELDGPGWDRATADAGAPSGGRGVGVQSGPGGPRPRGDRDRRAGTPAVGRLVRCGHGGGRLGRPAGLDSRAGATCSSRSTSWSRPRCPCSRPSSTTGSDLLVGRCTLPVNLAGFPALSLPVPTGGPLPASIQLIGPPHSEERLLAAGAWLESAVAAG